MFHLTFKTRLRCLALLASVTTILLVVLYRHQNKSSVDCQTSPDDPQCDRLNNAELRFTDFPPTKRLPHLDAGAQWCRESELKKPEFLAGREPQEWQEVPDRDVHVFSAFLDSRTKLGGPLIRIIASGLQEKYNNVGSLFCTMWYEDNEIPVTVGPAIYDLIYPSNHYPEMWVAHFILCPMPVVGNIGVPYAVSVTSTSCGPASNALMVLNRFPSTVDEFSFAVCFAPVYGHSVSWSAFMEWIELHKILGMTSAWFYNFSMEANVDRVIARYSSNSSDNIHVVQWKVPEDKLTSYFNQHGAINDCLYRAGHGHRYVTVQDIDEVMTPRKHPDWPAMMQFLFKPNVGAYLFQHAYFRRNTTGELPYLITQQSLWRTDVVTPPGKIRCKTMYRASKTIKADIHFPYKLVDTAEEYLLPPEDAMLHHYRSDPMETFRKHPEQFRFIEDRHMNRYKDRLRRSVIHRIRVFQMNKTNVL